ncbi:hypothetical protein PIB30_037258 [Stylosanthes scabra]|uniref:Zinc finger GRF-type domain-containing protein n=1 Tax=Stylosanthes scabra TaxID=79078 RepID=A0ABU6TFS7_9FABA|nr:hypothetical protein [Stylosanthes scabra]
MSRRTQSSGTRSRTLGEYSIGGDSRTCTMSSDSVGQARKKKFSPPKCHCGSYAIIFQSCTKLNPDRFFLGCPHYNTPQPHCNYFYWLDTLVEENTECGGSGRNIIFMVTRMKELEQRVVELEIKLNMRNQNSPRVVQDNKCLRLVIVGLISILFVLAMKGMF